MWLWDKASSGTFSSAAQETIWGRLLGPGNPSRVKSLANPKMAPLKDIYFPAPISILPPSHPSHSPKLSQILPFSLLSTHLPLHSLPHPRTPKFCLAIWSTSNIQKDNYMIFFGFTFLFSFSRIMNYRLNVLYMARIHFWVSTYHIPLFGSGIPHSVKRFLFPSICMQNSRCHCFLPLSKTIKYICSTPSFFFQGSEPFFPKVY